MNWIVVVVAAVAAGILMYWLLVTTEGAYLGARVVALLYDLVARRYDTIKAFDAESEEMFLTRPMMLALGERPAPLVLDVATGTGRVPLLLLGSPTFNGRVVGLDLARRMLAVAAAKAAGYHGRVAYIWWPASRLPFPADHFDLVTCLEALEFMPSPRRVLAEMVRVARPGAVIVATRRRGWESRLMPGKNWSEQRLRGVLDRLELSQVRLIPWQTDYDLVWARKPAVGLAAFHAARETATSLATGSAPLGGDQPERVGWQEKLLICPACGGRPMEWLANQVQCARCQRAFSVAADGVIELAAGSQDGR